MIASGRVEVNGAPARLGQRADPAIDLVKVDGKRLQLDSTKRYLMINKPAGVVTTSKDPEGRPTVLDLVGESVRLFPVGRLDVDTEGLLLLTNDGDLAYRLTHPSFEVSKTYVAQVKGWAGPSTLRRLGEGVDIHEDSPAKADSVRLLESYRGRNPRSVVEITIHEGRKHVVRRMLDAVGTPVISLVRTGQGPLKLGRLASGGYRKLTNDEIDLLYSETGL